jgi:hypothetical protein
MSKGTSYNNRLIVEAYVTDKSLRANVSNGFAKIEQKVQLKGLKVLIDGFVTVGSAGGSQMFISAGSTAYIKEELLHTQQWATKKFTCDTMPGVEFIVVDANHVEFITPPEEKPAA